MEYRVFGRSGLRVSQVGLGCGDVGGLIVRGEPDLRTRAVALALSLGINYFDTAPLYGQGVSETNLGLALKETKADVFVGTKVGLTPEDKKDIKNGVIRSLERSLKRLDMESVDLIQLHNRLTSKPGPEPDRPGLDAKEVLEQVVAGFQELQAQGKVRYYGITGLGETDTLQTIIDSEAMDSVQVCYNLLNPSAGTPNTPKFYTQDYGQLIDRAAAKGAGVIAIRVMAAGALTGVSDRHPLAIPTVEPIGSSRQYEEDVRRAGSFQYLVEEGIVGSLPEAALRFVLSKGEVSTALAGVSSLEQLKQSVTWAEKGPLPPAAIGGLAKVWDQFPLD